MGSPNGKNKLVYFFHERLFHLSQLKIIGTRAMRGFKRYVMLFSAYSVSRTTLSNVEGEWAVKKCNQLDAPTDSIRANARIHLLKPGI
jgi:hypothetical protein